MSVEDILGVAGFFLALALAGITIWDKLLRKPSFRIETQWVVSSNTGEPELLEIDISNEGSGKGSIRSLLFRTPASDPTAAWHEWEIDSDTLPRLPMVLDAEEASPRFIFVMAELPPALARAIKAGDAEVRLSDAGGVETHESLPAPGDGPPLPNPRMLK